MCETKQNKAKRRKIGRKCNRGEKRNTVKGKNRRYRSNNYLQEKDNKATLVQSETFDLQGTSG